MCMGSFPIFPPKLNETLKHVLVLEMGMPRNVMPPPNGYIEGYTVCVCVIIIIIIIIIILRSRPSQTPNWCMRPPCLWDKGPPLHNHLTAKVYRGIHTLPPSGFELVTS
jgi:hypothetical protein